jgi:hypothetical protein
MEFKKWVEAEKGRGAWVAAHFEVTHAAVTQWKTRGVPVSKMKAVRALSGDKVSLEEMVRPAFSLSTATEQ